VKGKKQMLRTSLRFDYKERNRCKHYKERMIQVNATSCSSKNRLKNDYIPIIHVIKMITLAKPQNPCEGLLS